MAKEDNNAVKVRNVSLALSGNTVLDDISLTVSDGEIFVLLGPSGCGKTTLLRSIAGLNSPDSGLIELSQQLCFDSATDKFLPPEQRSIGMVFQQGALFPHMNVAENVSFGLNEDDPQRVKDLLALVGMTSFVDRFPESLSGGQAQRVALARALAPAPKLMLLDEPFSALDSQLRLNLRTEVLQILKATGVTAIMVTHDQDEAFYIGDRIAVMEQGSIKQIATPRVLYESPATPWISEFVGEANLISGVLNANSVETVIGKLTLGAPLNSVSTQATVVIRPEHLSLSSGGSYRVVDKRYFGHDVLLTVHDGGETYFHVRSQIDTFEISESVDVAHNGEAVHGWPY